MIFCDQNMVRHGELLFLKFEVLRYKTLNAARGVAMLAVLAFLAVVFVLSTGFLNRQAPTMGVAANQVEHSQARMIAETGIDWLTVYLKETADNWRETRGEGAWIIDEPMYDGTLNIWVYDADGDGDLTDDESESIQVIAIGESNGVKHEVRAIVKPKVIETIGRLLLVVGQSPLDGEDSSRKALFESWGWEVAVIDDNASTADFSNAIAACDVIYVAYSTYSRNVSDNLTPSISRGIVSEETHLNDAFHISTADWGKVNGNTIEILNTSHGVSKSLELGLQDLCTTTNQMAHARGTLAPGAVVLGRLKGRSDASFVAVDTGSELIGGLLSGGRRVVLPYGSSSMKFAKINDMGRQLIRDSLVWAMGGGADDKMVAYWKLNSISGNSALDSSSGDHDGVLTGSSALNWKSAVFQNGLEFPGEQTSYVLIPEHEDFDLTAEGAVSMWIHADAYGDGVGLLHKGNMGNGSDEAYGLQINDHGRLRAVINSSSDREVLIGGSTLLTSTWYHVALCWNSTGVRLYVNGQLDAANNVSIEARKTDGDIIIGGWASNVVSGLNHNMPFMGLLDDIRIYSRSLTDNEIGMLYENGATAENAPTVIAEYRFAKSDPILPILVSHWRFDEPAASAVADDGGFASEPTTEYETDNGWTWRQQGYTGRYRSGFKGGGGFRSSSLGSYSFENQRGSMNNEGSSVNQFFGPRRDWGFDQDRGLSWDRQSRFGYGTNLSDGFGLGADGPDTGGGGGSSTGAPFASDEIALDELQIQNGQMVSVFPGQSGRFNMAYRFDGSRSAVVMNHQAAYALDDATLSFWFKADLTSGVQGLVSKDASGSGGGGHFEIALNDDLIVVQLDGLQDDIVLTSSTSIVADQWYHVGLTFNSRGAYLYIDGQLEDHDLSEWGLYAGSGGYGNSEPFVFGASSSSASSGTASPLSHYFQGMIDDVRLYDEAATIRQIQQVMNDLPVTEEDSDVIPDLSDYGAALDLVVSDLDQINWVDGGLQILSPVVIGATDASKLDDVLSVNDVFTVVLEFALDSVDPNVPSCLFGYLNSASQVNTAFWLDDGESEAELTAADGYAPSAVADGAISTGSRTQVILTYDGDELKQYIAGELVASEDRSGGLAWQSNYGLYVGNVPNGGMPMQGTLYRLVIYDDAVNALQAQNIYLGRPPGSASGGSQLTYERVWIERF